jgi:hypothetical protein
MSIVDGVFSLYPFHPSKAAPVLFAAIIVTLGCVLSYQSYRYKWHHFNILMTWASLVWTTGFIMRALSAWSPANVKFYLSSVSTFVAFATSCSHLHKYILVFVGPPLFAVSETFILGRLLAYMPYHSPLHPGRVLSTFLILGAVVESLSASGAASAGSTRATPQRQLDGVTLLKVSLILQEVVEICFFSLVAIFEQRCRKAGRFPRNVKVMCRVLYVTSAMMTVRCVVRTVEGFEASACFPAVLTCGTIQQHEAFLWILEVANITIFVLILAIWHPGRLLPVDQRVYLDPNDGKTQRLGPGYAQADNRAWLVTVFDPFGVMGMVRGRSNLDRFWERENPKADEAMAERERHWWQRK